MTRRERQTITAIALLLTVLLLITLSLLIIHLYTIYSIPQCSEDAVIVGVGDFVNGRWSQYVCGPALDDCTAVKQWQPYIP